MSVLEKIIAAIPELEKNAHAPNEDPRYIRKLSELTGGALQKNCDIMQLPNGDVVIAEVKTMFYNYAWDKDKGKFVRTKAIRKRNTGENSVSYESEDVSDDVQADATQAPAAPQRVRPVLKSVKQEERIKETA